MSEMPTLQTTSPSDSDLLTRFATSGDENAFAILMKRHWGFVFAIARRALTNTALAEDATQQTFITLAKKARSLCKSRPLGPWLYRTAIQESSNLRRREMRHQKRNQDYQAISQPESDPETQLSSKLHQALSSLSEKDRQLIILRYYQGLTADQIATQLKISPAAAQRRTLGQVPEPSLDLPAPEPFTCPHCQSELTFLREIPRPRGPPR